MGWNRSRTEYRYAKGTLIAIARSYEDLSASRFPVMVWGQRDYDRETTNLWIIAEIRADFDMALSSIGRKHWDGWEGKNFETYKTYGRLQRIVIADMLNMFDYELRSYGFREIPQMRGTAYSRMLEFLNVKRVKFRSKLNGV